MRTHLPRVNRDDLVDKFPAGVFEPPSSEEPKPVGLEILAEAAAAALALPDVRGRSIDAIRARRAAVLAAGPEASARLLAECLGLRPRAIHMLRSLPGEPALIRAIEKQAALLTALAMTAAGE